MLKSVLKLNQHHHQALSHHQANKPVLPHSQLVPNKPVQDHSLQAATLLVLKVLQLLTTITTSEVLPSLTTITTQDQPSPTTTTGQVQVPSLTTTTVFQPNKLDPAIKLNKLLVKKLSKEEDSYNNDKIDSINEIVKFNICK